MSFASRSAQALRAVARRAPRNVANVVAKTQVASYSLLARNTVAAATRAPAVQVGRVILRVNILTHPFMPIVHDSWSKDP